MGKLFTLGRILYSIPLAVFGIIHLSYVTEIGRMIPAWLPGHGFWPYVTGLSFLAAATGLALNIKARLAANLLGVMLSLFLVTVDFPRLILRPVTVGAITSVSLNLAVCAGAFLLAGLRRE